MNYVVILIGVFIALPSMGQKKQADLIRQLETKRITLSDGSKITPAGNSVDLGGMPVNLAVSHSGKIMAIGNIGQIAPSIQLLDLKTDRIISDLSTSNGQFLKFSYNDKFLYALSGNDNKILKYSVSSNGMILNDSIEIGDKFSGNIFTVGIEADERSNRLYVITKGENSLYVVDLKKKLVLKKLDLGGIGYNCILDKYSSTLFVSLWDASEILLINTISMQIMKAIRVGENPNDMVQSSNGKFLYVANAKDKSVSVIDLTQQDVVSVLDANLYKDDPPGIAANALEISEDDRRLYFVNPDNNCLAVFDLTRSGATRPIGFIPVGWNPTSVKVIKRNIYVANGRGFGFEGKKGTMSIIPEPGPEDLGVLTTITYRNTLTKKESAN
jgi:WD40 repeat protein